MYRNEKTKLLAALQEDAKRTTLIEEHKIRSKFQRDRDRILYCRAFRRLGGKTQVFLAAKDDHLRNRLTHSLEVNQISQTIAKALGLNLELTEAIALGHDLGHTPFGHVGERTLNHIMNGCYKIADFNTNINPIKKGFKHNFQGIRVVTELEENSLNLTKEVLWGILNHSKLAYKTCKREHYIECNLKHSKFKSDSDCSNDTKYRYDLGFYNKYLEEIESSKHWTIEALVVGIADEIAQRHHDIEDAIEFNILTVDSLIKEIEDRFGDVFEEGDTALLGEIKDNKDNKHLSIVLFSKLIVNFLTSDLIKNTEKNLEEFIIENNIKDSTSFSEVKKEKYSNKLVKELVSFSKEVEKVDDKLQDFLKNRILNSYIAQKMDGSGQYVIRKLFEAYVHNPQQLPDKTIKKLYVMLCKNIVENDKLSCDERYVIDDNTRLILDYEGCDDNKKDIGNIRDKISKLHYQLGDSDECKYSLYNDTLLRVICDFISGMTDKYALEQHKELYNCGDLMI